VFVDACSGVQVVVHGVNAVYKAAPWLPRTDAFDPRYSLSEADAQILQSWGLNGVRLGVMWPGAMPTNRTVDSAYLDKAASIVETLGQYGIYSLLDAHQDCLSGKFCGEGAPDWAIPTIAEGSEAFPAPFAAPYPLNASGYPSDASCGTLSWTDYQLTYAGSRGYQVLYSAGAARDGFATFWGGVARRFRNVSHVIGAEILNEPFAGAVWDDPLLLIPGVADRANLQPFYDIVGASIAENDPSMTVLFESVTWDDFIPVGFNHTPAPHMIPSNLTSISFHYYDLPNFNAEWQVTSRLSDAVRLGSGAFLTEFDINSASAAGGSLNETLVVMEKAGMSWIGWEYKPYVEITGWGWGPIFPNGSRNDQEVALLSRPYPQQVCGDVQSWSFDAGVFTLVYEPSMGCTTQVYLNCLYHFPGCSASVKSSSQSISWEVLPQKTPDNPAGTPWAILSLNTTSKMSDPVTIQVIQP
jgi:endoglycosylceramidase